MFTVTSARAMTKFGIVLAFLGALTTISRCQDLSQSDAVTAALTIQPFNKLDGPQRLDVLETTLPYVLKACLLGNRWMGVSVASLKNPDSLPISQSPPAIEQSHNVVPTFVMTGTLVAFAEKIRIDVTVRNTATNSVDFRGFEVSQEDTIVEAAQRIGKRVADALATKLASMAGDHQIVFGIASAFQNKATNTPYRALDSLLPAEILSQLSQTKVTNVVFQSLEGDAAGGKRTKPDGTVNGEYNVSGNIVSVTASIQESSGNEFKIEKTGSLDQVLTLADDLSKGIVEIVRGRVTADGKWRQESISLIDEKPEEYLAAASSYERKNEYATAIVMYRKAIERGPNSSEPHARLAILYLALKNYPSAIAEYQSMVRQNDQDAAARYGLGTAYLKAGNYQDAIREIQDAQKLPGIDVQMQAKLYAALADAYVLTNQTAKAIPLYKSGLALNPQSQELYHSFARAYRTSGSEEDLKRAVEILQEARTQFPDDPEFTSDLASVYASQALHDYDLKNYEQAMARYQQSLELHSNDPHVDAGTYAHMGTILGYYGSKLDPEKARQYLEKSIILDPNQEWVHFNLAGIYVGQKRYAEALETLKQGLAVEETADSYWGVGEVYRLQEKNELAIENLLHALQLRSDYANAYSSLGQVYVAQEDYRRAIENFDKCAKLNPTADTYSSLADAYFKNQQLREALEVDQKALKIDGRNEAAYNNLEKIYSAQNGEDKFIQTLQKAVRSDPSFGWAYTKMGDSYLNQQKYDDAIMSFNRAISIDKNDRSAHEGLVRAYFHSGDYGDAMAAVDEVLRRWPSAWAYTLMGRIFLGMHNDANAIEPLKHALTLNPQYTQAYDALDTAYTALNQPEIYIEVLKGVVAAHPEFAWAYRKLGEKYNDLEEYSRAIESLQKAIAIKSDRQTYLDLAVVYDAKEDSAHELEVAQKLRELDPHRDDSYVYTARAFSTQKNYGKALETLEQALKLLPSSPWLWASKGEIFRLQKEYRPAIDACQKALSIGAEYSYPHWVLTKVYLDQHDYANAATSAQKDIDSGGDDYDLIFLAYKGLNQPKEALRLLESYRKKSPQDAPIILGIMAVVYHESLFMDPSGYEQAYQLLKEAHERRPWSLEIRANLADASLTTGRYEDALRLAGEVLSDPDRQAEDKLSLKLLRVASLLCQKQVGTAFSELSEFVGYYKSIREEYDHTWTFDGTKNFIQRNQTLGGPQRDLLLSLIEIMESRRDVGNQKLAKLEGSLQIRFQQLQQADATPANF